MPLEITPLVEELMGSNLSPVVKDLAHDNERLSRFVTYALALSRPVVCAWEDYVPKGDRWRGNIRYCLAFLNALGSFLRPSQPTTFQYHRAFPKPGWLENDGEYLSARVLMRGSQRTIPQLLIGGVIIHNIIMDGMNEHGFFLPRPVETLVALHVALEDYGSFAGLASFEFHVYQVALRWMNG